MAISQTDIGKIDHDPLEREIEAKVRKEAKQLGILTYKFSSPGTISVPDRIFLKNSHIVFIEFKRKGGRLTKKQKREIDRMKEAGATVYVCWSYEEAMEVLIREYLL